MPSPTPIWQHATPVQSALASSKITAATKQGRGSRWYILGAATVTTLGVAVAVEASSKTAAKNAVKSTQTEADKRYQALLDSYGSGETLSDLENAVQNYK